MVLLKDVHGSEVDRMRLEILAASPPTSKCKHIISSMIKLVERNPDQLRLDIYYAGMQLTIKPTRGYQVEGKLKKVPSVFVNGICVANGEVPDFDEVEIVLARELSKDPLFWEK
jgi:hypothetical protein